MVSIGYPKHKIFFKNLDDNLLVLKVYFESKLILIQQSNGKDWIKLMYI